jgi:phage FluMu gp28-like protein
MKRPRKSPTVASEPAGRAVTAQTGGKRSHGQNHASHGGIAGKRINVKTGGRKLFPGKAKCIPKDPDALFLGYQSDWIRDNSRLKLMEKSRQVGMTWSTGYRRVREQSKVNRRWDTWVSSRDEGQAVLFLQDCRQWADLLQIGAKDLGEKVYEDETGRPFKAFEMETANGRVLHSMSSNPNAQAGKRGDRVLDEFALHQDPRKMYSIAYPGMTWGGQMEMISTHRGNLNFFAELVREIKEGGNPKKISLHTVTLQTALDQGFLYKLQRKLHEADPNDERIGMDEADYFNMVKSECADLESFLQEFMCIPADDRAAFLEWDLIASAEYGPQELWQVPLDSIIGDLYIGVDVGRRHDLTVIWVLEKLFGYWFTRRVIELKNTRFTAQEEILWPLIAHPKMRRCCIDATGLGMQLAERAVEKFSPYRVEAVTFTPAVKEELAYPVRAVMEERALKLPLTKEIRTDLRGVKKEVTASGNIRFTADTGPDGHSDRFWALALGIHAGKTPTGILLPPQRTKIWTPGESGIARADRSLAG